MLLVSSPSPHHHTTTTKKQKKKCFVTQDEIVSEILTEQRRGPIDFVRIAVRSTCMCKHLTSGISASEFKKKTPQTYTLHRQTNFVLRYMYLNLILIDFFFKSFV